MANRPFYSAGTPRIEPTSHGQVCASLAVRREVAQRKGGLKTETVVVPVKMGPHEAWAFAADLQAAALALMACTHHEEDD